MLTLQLKQLPCRVGLPAHHSWQFNMFHRGGMASAGKADLMAFAITVMDGWRHPGHLVCHDASLRRSRCYRRVACHRRSPKPNDDLGRFRLMISKEQAKLLKELRPEPVLVVIAKRVALSIDIARWIARNRVERDLQNRSKQFRRAFFLIPDRVLLLCLFDLSTLRNRRKLAWFFSALPAGIYCGVVTKSRTSVDARTWIQQASDLAAHGRTVETT